ncbi:MAG: hypothetical protein C0487_09540 [Leptothrix sp. (in: Bacteria)]|nr:hypothetical protein [Leptothrix sp. (in: b-proteobacteria)]
MAEHVGVDFEHLDGQRHDVELPAAIAAAFVADQRLGRGVDGGIHARVMPGIKPDHGFSGGVGLEVLPSLGELRERMSSIRSSDIMTSIAFM